MIPTAKFAGFAFVLAFLNGAMASETATLSPKQAFKIYCQLEQSKKILVRYEIEDGYYLYKTKFKFELPSKQDGLSEPLFSLGEQYTDEFFGDMEVFRKKVEISMTLITDFNGPFELRVTAQGCSDHGICFLPFVEIIEMYRF